MQVGSQMKRTTTSISKSSRASHLGLASLQLPLPRCWKESRALRTNGVHSHLSSQSFKARLLLADDAYFEVRRLLGLNASCK
jgi:hypothetical protein